jgi:hypothetical protein
MISHLKGFHSHSYIPRSLPNCVKVCHGGGIVCFWKWMNASVNIFAVFHHISLYPLCVISLSLLSLLPQSATSWRDILSFHTSSQCLITPRLCSEEHWQIERLIFIKHINGYTIWKTPWGPQGGKSLRENTKNSWFHPKRHPIGCPP